jgi:2'-5' RNA ligase
MVTRGAVEMELIGISIFGTALGVLGVFREEEHYQRILQFRAGLYADPGLSALEVRMTRPFIGHITLAYIEQELSDEQRGQLAEAVGVLNGQLKEVKPVFSFSGTGLRRYEHLSAFERSDGYPRYEF